MLAIWTNAFVPVEGTTAAAPSGLIQEMALQSVSPPVPVAV